MLQISTHSTPYPTPIVDTPLMLSTPLADMHRHSSHVPQLWRHFSHFVSCVVTPLMFRASLMFHTSCLCCSHVPHLFRHSSQFVTSVDTSPMFQTCVKTSLNFLSVHICRHFSPFVNCADTPLMFKTCVDAPLVRSSV